MARNSSQDPQVEEVDLPAADDVDEPSGEPTAAASNGDKPAKAAKNPRWAPPEGFKTLVGFAKDVSEAKLHRNRDGQTVDVPSQQVYSYAKNAPKDDKFPLVFFDTEGNIVGSVREDGPGETLTEEQAKERGLKQAVKVDEGLAWWTRKNERVAGRAQNAAEKAAKQAAKAASKPAEAEGAVEAEDGDVTYLTDGDEASGTEEVE